MRRKGLVRKYSTLFWKEFLQKIPERGLGIPADLPGRRPLLSLDVNRAFPSLEDVFEKWEYRRVAATARVERRKVCL